MNCLEFRRHYTVDPSGIGHETAVHRQQCPGCDRFAERMGEFEKRLREAMAVDVPQGVAERIGRRLEMESPTLTEEHLDRHLESAVRVDVPEGLAGRILLRHSFERQRRARRRRHLSAALTVGLALALGLSMFWPSPGSHRGLAHEVVAHIEEDTQALLSRAQVRDFALSATLANFGMYLEEDIGPLTYAGICEVGTTFGAHPVVAGESGPVTAIAVANLPQRWLGAVLHTATTRHQPSARQPVRRGIAWLPARAGSQRGLRGRYFSHPVQRQARLV